MKIDSQTIQTIQTWAMRSCCVSDLQHSQTRSSSGGDAIHDSGSGASGGVASPGSSACSVPTNLSNLRLSMPVLSISSI